MKKLRTLWLFCILLPITSIYSQDNMILSVIGDVASLDLGSFMMANSISGQPRIFQLVIPTKYEGQDVFIKGRVDWKQNLNSSYQNIFEFQTKIFKARSMFNDEIGNSDISIDDIHGNETLARDIASKGKPSGEFQIYMQMFSRDNRILASTNQPAILTFLNPAPTISISLPVSNSNVDVGNVQVSWTPVQGATKYQIQAGVLGESNSSVEDALQRGSLIVDLQNINPNVTAYGIKKEDRIRDWHDGQKIALLVKAIYLDSGKETEIRSEPIVFNLGLGTPSQEEKKYENVQSAQPDPNLVRLAKLVNGKVDQSILDKLNNGTIQMNQVQFENENGQSMSSADFLLLLGMLEGKDPNELTIKYSPKQ